VSPLTHWLIAGLALAVLVYAAAVLALVVAGRRSDARALAGFIPDCVILVKRLLADPRVPRRRKGLLVLLVAYLAMPIDLVPDFIPVAGQLDDAILVALVLRGLLRSAGPLLLREHWPGPAALLVPLERFVAAAPVTGGGSRRPR
jgi:uncharacterized membrane protein YkvA (DUF1232 family)